MHNCHKWDELSSMSLTPTSNTFTPVEVLSTERLKWAFSWNTLQTATNPLIRAQQMHPYKTKTLYPRRESEAVKQPPSPPTAVLHTYNEFIPTTVCQTIQAASPVELPMITAILGTKDAYVEGSIQTAISQAQCQKQDLKYSYIFPSSGKTSVTDVEDFISAEPDGPVTVDVGDAQIGKASQTAGYRAVYAQACNQLMPVAERPCSIHSLPIMTYPSDFAGASKIPTKRTPACLLGTEWPKVLS